MRVIVSGAGVGGLAVAQGLVGAGHDVVVLERGGGARSGPSGYRLRVDSRAVGVLRRLLPAPLFTALLASGTGSAVNQRLTYIDHRLRPLGTTRADDRDVLMIGRGPLLRLLAHGIGDRIRTRRASVSFRVAPEAVEVTTSDGRVEHGDVVVIAEGVHSTLRSQLLGGAPGARELGVGMILARVAGRPGEHGLSGIEHALAHGYALATGPGGIGAFLSAHDPVGGPPIDPAAVGPVPADLEDAYLVWALLGPVGRLPGVDATTGVLQSAAEQILRGWHPDLARLPGLSEVESVQRLTLDAARPVPTWPTTAVTVLGDAIHAVPPTGGIGASTAIRDAGHLVDALAGVSDRAGALDALHQYEHLVRTYADDVVAGSVAPLRWQERLRRPGVYTAVTAARATAVALTGRGLPLPSRH